VSDFASDPTRDSSGNEESIDEEHIPENKWSQLSRLAAHPSFAYPSILALQLKAMWGFWCCRDLSSGDTSGYFTLASQWATSFQGALFGSPLYTGFYGTIYRITGDVISATLIHRLVIVFTVTVLVLALARRLLPPAPAWLVAAWWAVLPINFDTVYEIHLFGMIPPLVAALILTRRPNPARRAAAAALLLTASVLVRNETLIAGVLFLLICLVCETWRTRRSGGWSASLRPLRPYVVALAIGALPIAFFYDRSIFQGSALRYIFDQKQRFAFCQHYAANYWQRHPEWNKNPFTECEELIESTFGARNASLGEAIRRNPQAVADYLRWNVRLLPKGVQLALFNESSGRTNPDYVPAALNRRRPLVLSILTALVLAAGAAALVTEAGHWRSWLRARAWALIVLGCSSVGVLLVMLLLRSRPSYMFILTVTVMVTVGLCVAAIVRRLNLESLAAALIPMVAVALLFLVPPFFVGKDRPLADLYRRMRPFAAQLAERNVGVVPGYGPELCNYLLASPVGGCTLLDYWTAVRPRAVSSGSIAVALNERGVRILYADEGMLADPIAQPLLQDPLAYGWRRVAGQGGRWMILRSELTYRGQLQAGDAPSTGLSYLGS
jgi:hypothetical protein